MVISNRKLAYIHIVKKELALNDAEYRGILSKVAGVRSAKDLDDARFRKLVNYLVRSGKYHVNDGLLTIKQKYLMERLAGEMGWDNRHLDNFIRKYYHVDGVKKLSRGQAVKAIESLKKAKEHLEKKE